VFLLSWDEDGAYWEVCGRLSISTDHRMQPGEFMLNHDCNTLMPLVPPGMFEDTGRRVSYGYVMGQPVYRVGPQARDFVYD
jgi:hypothetical protein